MSTLVLISAPRVYFQATCLTYLQIKALTGHMTTEVNVAAGLANSVGLVAHETSYIIKTCQDICSYLLLNSHHISCMFRLKTVIIGIGRSNGDEIVQLKATFPNLLVPSSCSVSFLRYFTEKYPVTDQ